MNKKIFTGMAVVTVVIIISSVLFLTTKNTTITPTVTETTTTGTQLATYTLEDVAKHNSETNCWMIINSSVVDVTKFIASKQHNPEIIRGCGIDATSMFNAERKHTGGEAQSLLKEYIIGTTI
jgi:cytochrome b involved in lipid metabolism